MSKLYIIGNGFDRRHCIPSSYSDFKSFLESSNSKDDRGIVSKLEDIYEPGVLWQDFEKALGTPNIDFINYARRVFGVEIFDKDFVEKIKNAFDKWIRALNNEYVSNFKFTTEIDLINFSLSDKFINFNYTLLLEEVYKVKQENIVHIHGDVAQTYFKENLIIGHGGEVKDGDHEIIKILKKDTIKNFKKFEDKIRSFLRSTSEIVCVGFSYSDIDLPYFEYINAINTNIKWVFTYYTQTDLENAELYIRKLKLNKNNYTLCDLKYFEF